jgi:lipoprotein-anchoring transpeptidase ErfK/SrfK
MAGTFSVLFLLGAFALSFGLAVQMKLPWALAARDAARTVPPLVRVAADATAEAASRYVVQPAWDWTARTVSHAWQRTAGPAPAPVKVATTKPKPPLLRPSLNPPVTPPAVAAPGLPAMPDMQLAEQPETEKEALLPAAETSPPSPGELARVLSHLKLSLTKELYDNFELFLFVSKADHGPWRQRMFVFAKQTNGDLKLTNSFPVSTGREQLMPSPDGTRMWHTNTPTGYFQIDADRIYKRYTSVQWGHKMPYAMFFSWENEGRQTGVAIHSAVDGDVKDLGQRASAGCVRLHPQNAALLYRLIKDNYRGLTPLFAYDRRTATMSKEGLLMHDKEGKLRYAEGYKVLVLIENQGGDDLVAALF